MIPLHTEAIERLAWLDAATAGREHGIPHEFTDERVGEALVLRCAGEHNLLFTRVIGLGASRRPTDAEVSQILRGYEDRSIYAFFVHVSPGKHAATTRQMLVARGFEPYPRAWRKLAARLDRHAATPRDPRVAPALRSDAPAISRIVAESFELPPSLASTFAALIERAGWTILVVREGGEAIAAAALFVQGRTGYLGFAATDPAHRGRGAQTALIAARLNAAQALGCDVVFTETGEPIPRERNISEANLIRAGFEVLYRRENWTLPGVTWSPPSRPSTTTAPSGHTSAR